jgi:xanthine dehydrogenase YagR molybdenum-binding subunit
MGVVRGIGRLQGGSDGTPQYRAIGSATMANAGAAVLLAAKAAREKAAHMNEVVVAEASYDPVEEANGPKAIFSFAAVYAEVRVDKELGLVRLNRFVGAYDAGRIINPKLARSQAIGGIIWGTGRALMEQSETDPAMGRFLHRNLSGYLVPTNADIPDLDVLFVGEFDAEASPLGAKGLGELTAVSVAPAIANAVYHATGKRIRDLPITIEKLITDGQTQ